MKRREFNQKAFLASLGLTLVDVFPKQCTCGGECYTIHELYDTQNEIVRQAICTYITNEKQSGNWDKIEMFYQHDPITGRLLDWKKIQS